MEIYPGEEIKFVFSERVFFVEIGAERRCGTTRICGNRLRTIYEPVIRNTNTEVGFALIEIVDHYRYFCIIGFDAIINYK